ncbi:hypothetical protein B296_00023363 [Ensete ventricosum]|uniref:Uncharacterized protein n=1 Tax=Ensete ventricosum TaxID=4639 RepID=A0A426ZXJ6_ENSVE|nr:hypothetical protein B296_00023363 [Ensete ventricosum]
MAGRGCRFGVRNVLDHESPSVVGGIGGALIFVDVREADFRFDLYLSVVSPSLCVRSGAGWWAVMPWLSKQGTQTRPPSSHLAPHGTMSTP